jgi:hypothetical protein
MVLNAGDALLSMLLLWAVFLPLGSRWSVDAIRRADGGDGPEAASVGGAEADSAGGPESETDGRSDPAVATVASMGVLLQMLVMYATNAVHKLGGDLWTGGEAVVYVIQADHFTYHLGNYVAQFPALLRAATFVWVAMLFASPLLVVLTGVPRAAVASLFVGAHLGMAATIRIDPFPIVAVVGFLLFLQTTVWDAAERGLTRFGPSGALARWRGRLESAGGTLAALDPSPWRPATVDPARLGGRPRRLGDALSAGIGRRRAVVSTALPTAFVVFVLLSSAASVGYAEVPEPGEAVLETAETDQHWQMFAPEPVRTTRWFAAPAVLENGSERDALRGGAVSLDRPPDVDATYPTARWRKYLTNVESTDNENHRSYLANHLCGEWNRTHATGAENVTVYHLYERTDPYNGTVLADGRFELIEYDCSGAFVQDA